MEKQSVNINIYFPVFTITAQYIAKKKYAQWKVQVNNCLTIKSLWMDCL